MAGLNHHDLEIYADVSTCEIRIKWFLRINKYSFWPELNNTEEQYKNYTDIMSAIKLTITNLRM